MILPELGPRGVRKRNDEVASLTGSAGDRDVTAVGSRNGSRKTEPETDSRLGSALVAPVESFEDPREIAWSNSNSRVLNGNAHVGRVLFE